MPRWLGIYCRKWKVIEMVELRLEELAHKMNGEILQGNPSLSFFRFNIDSRKTKSGELFFALQAERNGHDFVHHALNKGAAGAVISHKIDSQDQAKAIILVEETLEALQTLAQKVLLEHRIKIFGITGSVGKTTTKEFLFDLLSPTHNVLKSEGNYNNHIGLPLSLLKLQSFHELAILEYGMSSPGEITRLTQIAPPDISIITNIQPVHLEFFPSIHEIAMAKKEILDGTKADGMAVLNGDDPLVKEIAVSWKGDRIYFGCDKSNDISAQNVQFRGWEGLSCDFTYGSETEQIHLPFTSLSQLYNFLAASAAAYAIAEPVESLIKQKDRLKPFANRGQIEKLPENIKIINDSYNSNPAALKLALQSLARLPGGRKIAALGDMLELGQDAAQLHQEAGKLVSELGIDLLITVGSLSPHIAEGAKQAGMAADGILAFPDSTKAAFHIKGILKENDVILIKGSRGINMEIIIKTLKKDR